MPKRDFRKIIYNLHCRGIRNILFSWRLCVRSFSILILVGKIKITPFNVIKGVRKMADVAK